MKFPRDFVWGTATSAYQVEGGIRNNWTEWYDAGLAVDHWNRYDEDFDIAKSLGTNAYRFSIEWARIEPEEGHFDLTAIQHYKKMVAAMKARGLEPWLTIWHFTIPIWLVQKRGFETEAILPYFERFVKFLVENFQDDIKFWLTVNEPDLYARLSYLIGRWPPFKINPLQYYVLLKWIVKAHISAYRIIKAANSAAQISFAIHNNGGFFERWQNGKFLKAVSDHYDFIGLNFYGKPAQLYPILKWFNAYQKPIYITENGLEDSEDKERPEFISKTLEAAGWTIEKGVDLRGYFYWSLMDNFEWDKGFKPRFGLVEIDYKNGLKRIPRQSAEVYKNIICGS